MPAAKAGFSPLDRQLELGETVWSEGVRREAVWLSGAVPSYALAEEILRRVGQIEVSQSSIWRCTQEAGAQFQALEEAERERATALPVRGSAPPRTAEAGPRMGVSMDGASIHIRQEGWKELKLGVLFEVEVRPTPDKETGEVVDLAHAVHNSYVAHLGGPERLGELAWTEASQRNWEQAAETLVIGDGAPWIWHQAALHFPTSHQIVDWFHAKQHLVDAARLLKPEASPAYRRWLNHRETTLYQGHAEKIAIELEKAALKQAPPQAEPLLTAAGYFRTNHRRMNYIELREEEWPIGSGMVESGAKQFKARFAGPGMRWSRTGAEKLLPIRSAVLNARFDLTWRRAQNLPPT